MSAPSASPGPVLAMTGDLDVVSEHSWRRVGERFLAEHPDLRDITVDMSGVEFVDSRGFALLVWLHTAALSRGGTLELVSVPRRIATSISVAGLDQIFRVSTTSTV